MKKTIDFGMVRYNNRPCRVLVNLKLSGDPKRPVFSATAGVGNEMGGQCLDELLTFNLGEKFTAIHRLWKRWHLNDMQAGCEHQRRLPEFQPARLSNGDWNCHSYESEGGILCKPCPVCGYKYGEAWLYEPIAETDLEEMRKLISVD